MLEPNILWLPVPLFHDVSHTHIKENMDIIEESVILVFVEVEADKNVVFEAISKAGIVCNIEELKPAQLVKKLKQICNLYKVNVDDMTLNYLIETSGTNLQNLMNEIRKLIEYAGKGYGYSPCFSVIYQS